MEASEFVGTVAAMHEQGLARRLFFQHGQDASLRDRRLTLGGQEVVSWASCSYLGLEFHPALIRGVHDAVDRFGTQFSSSRGYVSSPQYAELEGLLGELFGGHVLATPTTTLGHQAALATLVTEKDGLVFDHQVHASLQVAATLARANGAKVAMIRHGEFDKAIEVVRKLSHTCRTVWVLADGVYSMYGDLAPIGLLREILDIADNVRLYVDDAHGMSWAGRHGRGSFLSRMPLSERVTVATSLNKAFAGSGGCIVFADRAELERVRMCGGPMLFSGPVQPPMLGALLASARVHLSDEITLRQAGLRGLIDLANRRIVEAGLPMLAVNESPIFFVRIGRPDVAMTVAERMLADGHFVNVSMYPSVPMKRAGLRLALTALHTAEQVEAVIASLARHVPDTLAGMGVTRTELDALFDGAAPTESLVSERYRKVAPAMRSVPADLGPHSVPAWRRMGLESDPDRLQIQQATTIADIDRTVWDSCLGEAGHCSWDSQLAVEAVFRNQPRPEHNWQFHYFLVRDAEGKPVCATFFTVALQKDDMLVRDQVSRAVELRRASEPYFLTSTAVMMGSGLSEGNHLWLDRTGPWRAALHQVLLRASELYEQTRAAALILRDLPADDETLNRFLLSRGLVQVPILDSHTVATPWRNDAELLAQASRRMRHHVRDVLARQERFRLDVVRGGPDVDLRGLDTDHVMRLYRNVADRKYRLNTFALPDGLLASLLRSPAWEVVTLSLLPEHGGPEDGKPVAAFVAHVHGGHYAPLFVGLDYRYVFTDHTYRFVLVQALRRAGELGLSVCHLGMDAEVEKRRLGAIAHATCVHVLSRDHYNGAVLQQVIAEVGLRGDAAAKE